MDYGLRIVLFDVRTMEAQIRYFRTSGMKFVNHDLLHDILICICIWHMQYFLYVYICLVTDLQMVFCDGKMEHTYSEQVDKYRICGIDYDGSPLGFQYSLNDLDTLMF